MTENQAITTRQPWRLRYVIFAVLAAVWLVFGHFVGVWDHHNGWAAIMTGGSYCFGVLSAYLLAPIWRWGGRSHG